MSSEVHLDFCNGIIILLWKTCAEFEFSKIDVNQSNVMIKVTVSFR